jgi:predicted dehydrogenase
MALSGGGQLNDSGSHLVDILLWTTGLVAETVYCDLTRYDTEVDIDSALTIGFTNGARGTISVVGNSPMWWEEFSVWGTEGVLLYRNGTILQRSFAEGRGNDMHVVDEELPPSTTPDRNFVDVILGRDTNRVPAECGLRVIELTQAAWKSAELGRVVRVAELA